MCYIQGLNTTTVFEQSVLEPIVRYSRLLETGARVVSGSHAKYPFSADGRGRCADLRIDNKLNAVFVEVYSPAGCDDSDYARNKSAIYAHPEWAKGMGEAYKGALGENPPVVVVGIFCSDKLYTPHTVRDHNFRKELLMLWDYCFILPSEPSELHSKAVGETLAELMAQHALKGMKT